VAKCYEAEFYFSKKDVNALRQGTTSILSRGEAYQNWLGTAETAKSSQLFPVGGVSR